MNYIVVYIVFKVWCEFMSWVVVGNVRCLWEFYYLLESIVIYVVDINYDVYMVYFLYYFVVKIIEVILGVGCVVVVIINEVVFWVGECNVVDVVLVKVGYIG